MTLFGRKKKTKEKPAESAKGGSLPPQQAGASGAEKKAISASVSNYAHVLVSPRITEKASTLEASGAYAFDVSASANKSDISKAVKQIYKVTPRKIRIVSIPAKARRSMRTGKRGVKHGGKKAYVYLKRGETMNIR